MSGFLVGTFNGAAAIQATATFSEGVTFSGAVAVQATATFSDGVSFQNESYGAQRVSSNFLVSATGLATAPPQYIIPIAGQNIGFDGTLFLQAQGAAGARLSVLSPSGCVILADMSGQALGPTAFNSDIFSFTGGSAVGTGVYAIGAGAKSAITVAGTIVAATGVTGNVVIGVMPITNGQTMTYLANSNVFVYPST